MNCTAIGQVFWGVEVVFLIAFVCFFIFLIFGRFHQVLSGRGTPQKGMMKPTKTKKHAKIQTRRS